MCESGLPIFMLEISYWMLLINWIESNQMKTIYKNNKFYIKAYRKFLDITKKGMTILLIFFWCVWCVLERNNLKNDVPGILSYKRNLYIYIYIYFIAWSNWEPSSDVRYLTYWELYKGLKSLTAIWLFYLLSLSHKQKNTFNDF